MSQAVSNIVGALGWYSVMNVGRPSASPELATSRIAPSNESGAGLSLVLPYMWWAIPPSLEVSRPSR